jgi:hypothetical protein
MSAERAPSGRALVGLEYVVEEHAEVAAGDAVGPGLARANGCELPLVGRDYRFAAAMKGATNGRGADVTYDSLGRAAMEENLEALALCGHPRGLNPPVDPMDTRGSGPVRAQSHARPCS